MEATSKYWNSFFELFPRLVAEGKMKYQEDITIGLENMGDVLLKVMKGDTVGKPLVRVA
jgi:NADPH-dependent curcumin reductase CurA